LTRNVKVIRLICKMFLLKLIFSGLSIIDMFVNSERLLKLPPNSSLRWNSSWICQHSWSHWIANPNFFVQIIGALKYFAEEHVCHRDLRLDNICLDNHRTVKVIDFGFGHRYDTENPSMNVQCGTPGYSAPDLMREWSFTQGWLGDFLSLVKVGRILQMLW
jgi:hypothetical protein